MKRVFILLAIAALCGMGLGTAAWGLGSCQHGFLWWDASHQAWLMVGAALGVAWALAHVAFWRWIWDLEWISGLRGGVASLFPWLLGFGWRLFNRPILPHPHDLALRSLQIFLAGLLLAALFKSFMLLLLRLHFGRNLDGFSKAGVALRLGACAWIFFLLSGFWGWSWRNTGDQPHYLLMAQSLWEDHDLDLANNYASGEWRAYYDRAELTPQYPAQGKPGAWHVYTEHKPLISFLAAPFFGLFGSLGGLLVSSLIAALGAGLVAWLALNFNLGTGAALLGFALCSFNAAWWTHSAAFYPDALSGLLMLCASAALAGQLSWWFAPVCVAAMAWANVRCYPAAFALFLLLLWQWFRAGNAGRGIWLKNLAAFLLIGISFALALRLNASQFGSSSPLAAYHSVHKNFSDLFAFGSTFRQAAGQWMDQEYGLLTWAPALLFGVLGFLFWKRFSKAGFWFYVLPALAYYGPVAVYWDWTGVMAPCRYLVPWVPLLSLSACFAFIGLKNRRWLFWPLFLATCAEGLLVAVLPWLNFSKMDGKNLILQALGTRLGLNLTGFFPTFMMWCPRDVYWILGLFAFIFVNWAWLHRAGSRDLLDPR